MYTWNVTLKLRPGGAPEFRRLLEQKIIPLLRTQKGFQDEITLVAAERNEALIISFWDNQENADDYNHVAYLDVLRTISKVVEDMPIMETFEVVDSAVQEFGATAA
ncbi:MAG: antibiotic biosynthesis monooxygenase [Candidatus Binatia bacterium]